MESGNKMLCLLDFNFLDVDAFASKFLTGILIACLMKRILVQTNQNVDVHIPYKNEDLLNF